MDFDRHQSAGYMTNWAARLFAKSIDKRLSSLDVASGQLPIFFALAGGRQATQAELTKIAAIEQPTMAATLNRMEKAGLIARRPDDTDRRRTIVQLTRKAEEKAQAIRQAVETVNGLALASLSDAERIAFLDMLGRICVSLADDVTSG
ncbi:winged helix-turn-helix transcriptional regulator [Rhodospirillaceae bacterium KN72]|uniref:Winged helix-turn-helix transcriptional regulator n=1 Tax=Pacificispira spongiicola TaxID=2729598 RepID=A0A7Y0DYU5_9PROT|nr:MarR family winged helix-turn-helix transcriptional regulator [Pacificispira spongiicola]NMM44100.1 winged helix-turn-helix transcriptional regulator [Pacificispira spongiicola]